MTTLTRNGTDGRVYGGDCDLIHIQDGKRAQIGRELAQVLDAKMRADAYMSGARSERQIYDQSLCPGCYMVAIFNAAVELARKNGQPLAELGNSMAQAFQKLAQGGEDAIEEIHVILD